MSEFPLPTTLFDLQGPEGQQATWTPIPAQRPKAGTKRGFYFGAPDVHTNNLPDRSGRMDREGVLYVLEFTSGLMKVGRTARPLSRITTHIQNARFFASAQLQRGWLSIPNGDVIAAEKELVRKATELAENVEGREYLVGVDFDAAVDIADRAPWLPLMVGPLTPDSRTAYTKLMLGGWPSRDCETCPNRRDFKESLSATTLENTALPSVSTLAEDTPSAIAEAALIIADGTGESLLDVIQMSYLDQIERIVDSQAQSYRFHIQTAFYRLHRRILEEGRHDLLAPMLTEAQLDRVRWELVTEDGESRWVASDVPADGQRDSEVRP